MGITGDATRQFQSGPEESPTRHRNIEEIGTRVVMGLTSRRRSGQMKSPEICVFSAGCIKSNLTNLVRKQPWFSTKAIDRNIDIHHPRRFHTS